MHSFTPVFKGVSRPWQIGVLYHRDQHLAPAVIRYIQENTQFTVGVNEPYSVGDETDYGIPSMGRNEVTPVSNSRSATTSPKATGRWKAGRS
jgi:predicted N-formylglutamate amidohydrolase